MVRVLKCHLLALFPHDSKGLPGKYDTQGFLFWKAKDPSGSKSGESKVCCCESKIGTFLNTNIMFNDRIKTDFGNYTYILIIRFSNSNLNGRDRKFHCLSGKFDAADVFAVFLR